MIRSWSIVFKTEIFFPMETLWMCQWRVMGSIWGISLGAHCSTQTQPRLVQSLKWSSVCEIISAHLSAVWVERRGVGTRWGMGRKDLASWRLPESLLHESPMWAWIKRSVWSKFEWLHLLPPMRFTMQIPLEKALIDKLKQNKRTTSKHTGS